MKNLNTDEKISSLLRKTGAELNPSRDSFNKLIYAIQKKQNVTKKMHSRYVGDRDWPSIINNIINSMNTKWKIVVPAMAIASIALIVGYSQVGTNNIRLTESKKQIESTGDILKKDIPMAVATVDELLSSISMEESLEQQEFADELADMALLSEDSEDLNNLSQLYENELL